MRTFGYAAFAAILALSSAFLSATAASAAPSAASAPLRCQAVTTYWKVGSKGAVVHTAPSGGSSVVTRLGANTKVTSPVHCTNSAGSVWYCVDRQYCDIEAGDRGSWVWSSYLVKP
ncbi:hypothetical protein [Streptomyces sp. NPDC052225]|uniref:hypothetical protein n=1 Tax=Streptomyces sp. NPDC052225 TaxID=3154949 RepID=UPI00341D6668